MPPLVLASTSPYRRELLARLRLPFEVVAPLVDEAPRGVESPRQIAVRLSLAKATAGLAQRPTAIVIGSDQVAELDGRALNKPGHHEAAVEQLTRLQGRQAHFHTGLAVVGGAHPPRVVCVSTIVRLRVLSASAIHAYLAAEPAYDCAGAARIESLGIALMTSVASDDPTALIGLPLIQLVSLLAERGVNVLPH